MPTATGRSTAHDMIEKNERIYKAYSQVREAIKASSLSGADWIAILEHIKHGLLHENMEASVIEAIVIEALRRTE